MNKIKSILKKRVSSEEISKKNNYSKKTKMDQY